MINCLVCFNIAFGFNLCRYNEGRGVAQNHVEAFRLFQVAAGDPCAAQTGLLFDDPLEWDRQGLTLIDPSTSHLTLHFSAHPLHFSPHPQAVLFTGTTQGTHNKCSRRAEEWTILSP